MTPEPNKNIPILVSRAALLSCLIAGLYMLVFFPYWSWSLYDEISWLRLRDLGLHGYAFLEKDFADIGRIRPLSVLVSLWRMQWVDELALKWQRVATYGEFTLLLALFYGVLRYKFGVSVRVALFSVALLIKSPPILELLHVYTLSELRALWLTMLALLIGSGPLWGLFTVCAALAKEPFALLVPLAPFVGGNIKKAIIYLFIAVAYVGALYLKSRGVYYSSHLNSATWFEILSKAALDYAPMLAGVTALVLAAKKENVSLWLRSEERLAFVGFIFYACFYFALVAPKSWGWTFHFAPVVVLSVLAFALYADRILIRLSPNKSTTVLSIMLMLTVLMPLRLPWNLMRLHHLHTERFFVLRALKNLPQDGLKAATNCIIDGAGLAYAASKREESALGQETTYDMKQICKDVGYLSLLAQCPNYDLRKEEATAQNLVLIEQGEGWSLYSCQAAH